MIERLTGLGIGKLENGRVVERGNVLFGGEHVLAEKSVGFSFVVGGVIEGLTIFIVGVFKLLSGLGDGAVHHGGDGLQMILLHLRHGCEKGVQIGGFCHGGVFLIFGDAKLLLTLGILEQAVFFLR